MSPEGTIYFVQAECGGPVKIGFTVDVDERVKALQCGSPFPLRVVATRPGTLGTEAELHRRFARHRLHGEWFEASDDIERFLQKPLAPALVAPQRHLHAHAEPNPTSLANQVLDAWPEDDRWHTAAEISAHLAVGSAILAEFNAPSVWRALATLHEEGRIQRRWNFAARPHRREWRRV